MKGTVTVYSHTIAICRLQRMAVRATLCLLLVRLEDKVTSVHECNPMNRLVDCEINPRLTITKSNHYYYLSILMCSNQPCSYTDVPEILNYIQWMECNRVCENRQSLTRQG